MTADVAAVLAEVCERLERIETSVDMLLTRGRLSRPERALLLPVLPVVGRSVGEAEFGACDVLDLSAAKRLLHGYSAAELAWLFRRAEGQWIGGLRLEAAGRDRTGALWRLRAKVTARRTRAVL